MCLCVSELSFSKDLSPSFQLFANAETADLQQAGGKLCMNTAWVSFICTGNTYEI